MEKRSKSAVITLITGLALNIALGAAKLTVGILSNSASVSSDAFNNLSDAAVSVVSIIALWLASRGADHDHPYGHGRYEYIATFILGAVIVAVGVEVLTNGIKRAVAPQPVELDVAVWATLGASVGIKAFMAAFYFVRGRAVKSDAIGAAAVDSLSDAAVTTVVLACALIQKFVGVDIDGYVSIAVAAVILVFAVRILKRTISRLLGERPDAKLVDEVNAMIEKVPNVISSHDLIINDYGEQNKIAEVDLVFPSDMSFVDVHDACDALERAVKEKTGVRLSVHADPYRGGDARLDDISERISGSLAPFGATAHDIVIDDGTATVKLDISVPRDGEPIEEIKGIVKAQAHAALGYDCEIHIDYL